MATERAELPNVGDPAPALDVETLDGGRVSLAEMQGGRHLVVHFMREFT
jgi:peroxiredoxin